MKSLLKPWGRALKYGVLKRRAERSIGEGPPAAFLVGCGRSGTTVLGEIFQKHPDIKYHYEPYHLWATLDPFIDVLNLYHAGAARFLLDEQHSTPEARRRFDQLFLEPARRRGYALMLEKTPFNICRIGYLEALKPGSKYVHLVRDGVDVCRSIDRLSRDQSYRIAGKPALNRWWGRGGSKWTALAGDGMAAGYFPDEVPLLKNYEAKGAYEWVVSMREMDRWRDRLGDRLLEMRYERLASAPQGALKEICEFLGVEMPRGWFARSVEMIESPRHNDGQPLVLPPGICEAFNQYQERFMQPGRAVTGTPASSAVQIAVISNEPTPYRLHVLDRMASELEGVHVHNIFTHTISNPSMPWQMQIGAHLNPVFFPQNHLTMNHPVSSRCFALYGNIRDHLEKNDIQLVILLGYNDLTRLLLVRWGRRSGIPVALTSDSNIFSDVRVSPLGRMVKRQFVRWVLRRIAALMPMGTCGRAFFRRYMDHDLPEFLFPYEPPYESLANPDVAKLEAFRLKHDFEPQRKRFLYCGRLVEVKRVDVLLASFARVALARPDWDLVIAGDGPLRQKLADSIPDALRSRVKWLGFLQLDETVLAYHSCDALVLPSEFEPWALVVNEAVACNLPVVTTSVVGAAVELVRHKINGLIVPPRSVEAMTEALLEITEPGRCEAMRRECPQILEAWRQGADPVDGVRSALRHFGLIWRQPGRTEAVSPMSPISTVTMSK